MATAVRTAVVVGAGTGGMAVAGGLSRAGWQVVLLEAADRPRPGPAAVLMWPGGVHALRALGVADPLSRATRVPDPGVRTPAGRWLAPPDPEATPALLIHAEDLHDALVAGLGDYVDLRTGVRAAPAPGPRPAVTDGRHTWAADLVVAADGAASSLRSALAPGGTVTAAGATVWRAVVPWYRDDRPALDPAAPLLLHGGGHRFFAASLTAAGGDRTSVYWTLTGPGAPRPEPAATRLELLRRWLSDWPAPVAALLAATEPADVTQQELRVLRPEPRRLAWRVGDGAVVLLGDAAHTFPDHLGVGGCLALEDAAALVAAVADAEPGEALHRAVAGYDRRRRARAARVRRWAGRPLPAGVAGGLPAVVARHHRRAWAAAAEPPAMASPTI